MTSILKILGVAMVVGVVCVGAVALATDFVWDSNTTDTSWLTANNWDQNSSYPQNDTDNATIDAGGNLCTYDPGSELTINKLSVGGSSPTWRKLHIEDAALTVANDLTLGDYGQLDIDHDLTIEQDIHMSGSVKIDIASGKTMECDLLYVDGANTVLDLTTSGTFITSYVGIGGDDVHRRLKLDGGTITLGADPFTLHILGDTDGYKSKFWLSTGAVVWGGGVAAKILALAGGDDFTKDRAELDLDQDMSLPTDYGQVTMGGAVKIDIAANKTLSTPILGVAGPAFVRLVAASGGKIDVD